MENEPHNPNSQETNPESLDLQSTVDTNSPFFPKRIEDEFIDMSFIQTLHNTSLTEDQGVIKYTKQDPRENPPSSSEEDLIPKSRARCRIRFEARTESGELVDKKRNRKELKAFKLNVDATILGLHHATASLKQGEEAWFRFEPQYHFGEGGVPGEIPPNAVLYYKVHLDGFINEKGTLANDDYDGRIVLFNQIREKGNEFFKSGDYENAFKEYKKGCDMIKQIPKALLSKLSKEQSNVVDDLKLKMANNAAITCIKLNKHSEGLQYINIVLSLDEKNAKALFRKGQCEMGVGNFDQAKKSFEDSLNAGNPEKSQCMKHIKQCSTTKGEKLKDEKKLYQNMFQKMAQEEEKEKEQKRLQEKIERKKERERLQNEGKESGTEKKEEKNQENRFNIEKLLEGTVIDKKELDVSEMKIDNPNQKEDDDKNREL